MGVQLVNQSRLVISEHTLVNMISKPLDGRKMLVLSMIHILCGFICIIIETVKVSSTFNQHTMATYGEGFYCGAIFLLTGIFDLVKKQEKMTFEKTSFGLKILSAVAGGWIFTISGGVLVGTLIHKILLPPIVIHFFLTLCGAVEIIISIFSASFGCFRHCFCCYRCCCSSHHDDDAVAHASFQDETQIDVEIKDTNLAQEVKNDHHASNTKSNGYSRFP